MKEAPTINVRIYMAGDHLVASDACLSYYKALGGCVTVTPTSYVYTGGSEQGFVVGFINYPPYPDNNEDSLLLKAMALADVLAHELGQESYTIQGPTRTITYGRDHIQPQ